MLLKAHSHSLLLAWCPFYSRKTRLRKCKGLVKASLHDAFFQFISTPKSKSHEVFDSLIRRCQTQIRSGPKLSSDVISRARLNIYGKSNLH